MDNAVALVRAYLHLNGYFTVCEFPVLEATRSGYRTVTDLDVLAFRFPGAGRLVAGLPDGEHLRFEPDPMLGAPAGESDMLIGEVKEGRARFNESMEEGGVLEVALTRFGCCHPQEAPELVRRLRRHGEAVTSHGHRVRLVVFASTREGTEVNVIALGHVVAFLEDYLSRYWDAIHHAQFKDPAFGFLMTLRKAAASFT